MTYVFFLERVPGWTDDDALSLFARALSAVSALVLVYFVEGAPLLAGVPVEWWYVGCGGCGGRALQHMERLAGRQGYAPRETYVRLALLSVRLLAMPACLPVCLPA